MTTSRYVQIKKILYDMELYDIETTFCIIRLNIIAEHIWHLNLIRKEMSIFLNS